jgi:hypothetical protein
MDKTDMIARTTMMPRAKPPASFHSASIETFIAAQPPFRTDEWF